jgi:hypothetical protein
MGSEYRELVVQTYLNVGEESKKRVRARPFPGQGVSATMNVECSESMRVEYPIGTRFVLRCKETCKEGGTPFLYSSWQWPYRVVTAAQARAFIARVRRHEA